jgi:hypothetical protein
MWWLVAGAAWGRGVRRRPRHARAPGNLNRRPPIGGVDTLWPACDALPGSCYCPMRKVLGAALGRDLGAVALHFANDFIV